MSRVWFTADMHFGHARVVDLCARPFADVDQMNQALIDNWNRRVAPDDVVWVLGDVALGKRAETVPLCRRLHGKKLLIPGNHDSCWPHHKKVRPADVALYADAGFTVHAPEVAIGLHGHRVVLCHLPYAGDSHPDDRYARHRPPDEGDWLVHGHVHEAWRVRGRQINVGVDVWDYAPASEDELARIIEEGHD